MKLLMTEAKKTVLIIVIILIGSAAVLKVSGVFDKGGDSEKYKTIAELACLADGRYNGVDVFSKDTAMNVWLAQQIANGSYTGSTDSYRFTCKDGSVEFYYDQVKNVGLVIVNK